MPFGPLVVGLPRPPRAFLRGEGALIFHGYGGCRFEVAAAPQNKGYLASPDWTDRERWQGPVAAAVKAVRS